MFTHMENGQLMRDGTNLTHDKHDPTSTIISLMCPTKISPMMPFMIAGATLHCAPMQSPLAATRWVYISGM